MYLLNVQSLFLIKRLLLQKLKPEEMKSSDTNARTELYTRVLNDVRTSFSSEMGSTKIPLKIPLSRLKSSKDDRDRLKEHKATSNQVHRVIRTSMFSEFKPRNKSVSVTKA